MSVGETVFSGMERIQNTLGSEDFFEARFENDSNGNPIYAGWTPIVNGETDAGIWYIKKIFYDGNQSIIRVQLPDEGVKFSYVWDDRASLFS